MDELDNSLNFRLELLQNSEQASAKTIGHVRSLASVIVREEGIKLTEENGAMLITHFCIAIERSVKNEPVNPIDESVRTQIFECESCSRAESLLSKWSAENELPQIHENEKDFMLMHLCTLLEGCGSK